jgi:hypothetical protein
MPATAEEMNATLERDLEKRKAIPNPQCPFGSIRDMTELTCITDGWIYLVLRCMV